MTVRDFIKELQNLKEELMDLEIRVKQPNGLLTPPEIKFLRKDEFKYEFPLKLTKDTIKYVIIE